MDLRRRRRRATRQENAKALHVAHLRQANHQFGTERRRKKTETEMRQTGQTVPSRGIPAETAGANPGNKCKRRQNRWKTATNEWQKRQFWHGAAQRCSTEPSNLQIDLFPLAGMGRARWLNYRRFTSLEVIDVPAKHKACHKAVRTNAAVFSGRHDGNPGRDDRVPRRGRAYAEDSLESLAKPQEGRSMRATSTMRVGEVRRGGGEMKLNPKGDFKGDLEEASNWDNYTIPPGQTHVMLDEQGPGVITHMWITFLGPEPQKWAPKGSANHQEMLLRMYWDGSQRPAVEAPLGDFFANCFGKRSEVVSLPVTVANGTAYNCFWRMPFRKSARIEIVNQSAKPISLLYYNIDWIKKDRIPEDTPYFYAQYRQEYPVKKGQDYVFLETKGKGHYVGTVLAVRTRSPAWFGEGDEKIYIDGERKPSIQGTGTEDYFLCAWGLKRTSTPYFGVPVFRPMGHRGRAHLGLPLAHQRPDRLQHRHQGEHRALRLAARPTRTPSTSEMSWNEREDDYASVAFWYQTGEPTFTARAPHARERRLPSLERITVPAVDLAVPGNHGAGENDRSATRSLRRQAVALHAREGRRRVAGDSLQRGEKGAAAVAAERDEELRFRQISHFARTA